MAQPGGQLYLPGLLAHFVPSLFFLKLLWQLSHFTVVFPLSAFYSHLKQLEIAEVQFKHSVIFLYYPIIQRL